MYQPLSIPAAWCGKELFERKDWPAEARVGGSRGIAGRFWTSQRANRSQNFNVTIYRFRSAAGCWLDCSRTWKRVAELAWSKACPLTSSRKRSCRLFWSVATHVGTPVSQIAVGERIFSVRNEGFPVGHPQVRAEYQQASRASTPIVVSPLRFSVRSKRGRGRESTGQPGDVVLRMSRRRPDLVNVLMRPFHYARTTWTGET